MNWINGFEILCYAITLLFLIDIIRKKSWNEFWLFVSAAVAGFALELLAVRVTDIYHYSQDFFISIGFKPYQFPFFGGLMWGGLTVYALRIARKLKRSPLMTALIGGWLIVTMDLLLDVAAIRLNGGFWVWDGREITPEITHHMFMSVIWVNFLGYMFETPAMIYISLRTEKKREQLPWRKQLLAAIGIGFAGVAFVGAASSLALLLNSITDEWFACIAFVVLWITVFIAIVRAAGKNRLRIQKPAEWDVPVLIYWLAMYGFCIAALNYLGMAAEKPIYFTAGIILGLGTLVLAILKRESDPDGSEHHLVRPAAYQETSHK
ncbi:MAG: hypothetical protein II882_09150 [Lachnospiraceae bacterium]|nr:hypothetical protein [Lachnospiraceae bacterium]